MLQPSHKSQKIDGCICFYESKEADLWLHVGGKELPGEDAQELSHMLHAMFLKGTWQCHIDLVKHCLGSCRSANKN